MRVQTRVLAALPAAALGILLVPSAAAAHESHTVAPGETLGHIAIRHGVSVSAIVAENGITNPNRIRVGQVLSIPHPGATAAATPPPAAAQQDSGPKPVVAGSTMAGSYTVQPGDSLGKIGQKLGVSWRDVARENNIGSPYVINVGQVLRVPGGASSYPNLPRRIREDPTRLAIIPSLEKWAAHYGVPTDLLMGLAWQESGWRNDRVSSAGAYGIGQIMPATGEWIAASIIGNPALDRREPEHNIQMSAAYLAWLIRTTGTEQDALAGYYQGLTSVRNNGWYTSTIAYVNNVLSHRAMFKRS